jgi:predicted nucleic acid-binding protein
MAARRRRRKKKVPHRPHEARKVYVETSVWGMMLENQPRALREPTKQFLRQCAEGLFVPYISTVVLQEIALAGASAAAQMVREISKLTPLVLEPSEESEELAEAYLEAGVIPHKKRDDARHVALATVAGLEIVVSWNHRHLANERKSELYNAVNRLAGYEQVLVIHTPFEVMQ